MSSISIGINKRWAEILYNIVVRKWTEQKKKEAENVSVPTEKADAMRKNYIVAVRALLLLHRTEVQPLDTMERQKTPINTFPLFTPVFLCHSGAFSTHYFSLHSVRVCFSHFSFQNVYSM